MAEGGKGDGGRWDRIAVDLTISQWVSRCCESAAIHLGLASPMIVIQFNASALTWELHFMQLNDFLFLKFQNVSQPLACSKHTCLGAVMYGGNFPLIPVEARKPEIVLEHAKDFLDQYFTSIRK